MDNLKLLKFNIRELSNPYFEDSELYILLEKNNNDVNAASYEALLMKSENESINLPDGLSLSDNRQYWLSLARKFRANHTGPILRGDMVD